MSRLFKVHDDNQVWIDTEAVICVCLVKAAINGPQWCVELSSGSKFYVDDDVAAMLTGRDRGPCTGDDCWCHSWKADGQ